MLGIIDEYTLKITSVDVGNGRIFQQKITCLPHLYLGTGDLPPKYVTINLEDGEKYMDWVIFEKCFGLSEYPKSLELGDVRVPATLVEYTGFERILYSQTLYPSIIEICWYLKICDFMMAREAFFVIPRDMLCLWSFQKEGSPVARICEYFQCNVADLPLPVSAILSLISSYYFYFRKIHPCFEDERSAHLVAKVIGTGYKGVVGQEKIKDYFERNGIPVKEPKRRD